jgi:hypothetical protein
VVDPLLALSVSDVEHLETVATLRAEVDAWRAIAKAAIESLNGVTTDREQVRSRYHAALDELKALRYQVTTGVQVVQVIGADNLRVDERAA